MKLIFCPACQDVIRLTKSIRTCECKLSGGRYLDSAYAEYWGGAIPFNIDNSSFIKAIKSKPLDPEPGEEFTAFIIPRESETTKHVADITRKERR